MEKKVLSSIVAAAGLAVTGLTFAGGPAPMPVAPSYVGWYVGVGVKHSALWDWREDSVGHFNGFDTDLRDDDVGFDAFVGYRWDEHWGLELGYAYLGDMTFNVVGTASRARVHNQWNLHLIGLRYIPLTQNFELYGDAGVAYMYQKINYSAALAVINSRLSTLALTYGVGAQFNFDQFGFRLDYRLMHPMGPVRNNVFISDYASFDVFYRFTA